MDLVLTEAYRNYEISLYKCRAAGLQDTQLTFLLYGHPALCFDIIFESIIQHEMEKRIKCSEIFKK